MTAHTDIIDAELLDDEPGDAPIALKPATPLDLPAGLAEKLKSAQAYRAGAENPETRRTYLYAWEHWMEWAVEHELSPLPAAPVAIATYLAELADEGYKPNTLNIRLAAIRYMHRAAGEDRPDSPELQQVLKGIRRKVGRRGQAKVRRAAANVLDDLRQLLAAVPAPESRKDLRPARDRMVLSVMWAGALRASDLIVLQLEDLVWRPEGVVLTVPISKGDQEGQGQAVPIPYAQDTSICAARALRDWCEILSGADIETGPVIRATSRYGTLRSVRPAPIPKGMSRMGVHNLVQRYYRAAGLGDELGPRTTHSMRAGRITQAFEDGASLEQVIQMSRHKNPATALVYRRHADPFAGIPPID